MSNEKITSENLEELFDEGCDVTGFFDFDSAVVVEGRTETKRVNVDMPIWMVEALGGLRHARRIGGACVPDPPLRLAPRLACPVNFL